MTYQPIALADDSLWLFIPCADGTTAAGRLAICDHCGQMLLLEADTDPAALGAALRWATVTDLAEVA